MGNPLEERNEDIQERSTGSEGRGWFEFPKTMELPVSGIQRLL